MKKQTRKTWILFTLIFTMLFSSVTAEAATFNFVQTLYASGEKKESGIDKNLELWYGVSTIKSAKTSVAKVFDGKVTMYGIKQDVIGLVAKKAGTANVTMKAPGGSTSKMKLTVKKYTSPFSGIKINGKSIAPKFKTKSVYTLPYAEYKNKKVQMNFKAKSGWKLSANYGPYDEGKEALKNNQYIKVNKKGFRVAFDAYNTKTKQNESCEIIWK